MKNTKRRGFTIVELVIVIAVIAILAAVLIPTFSNLIKKANVTSDTQLAKNMNTALAIAQAEGKKNETFSEALDDILKAGYIVESLTPTAENYHLVWDQDADRIVFIQPDGVTVEYAENNKVNDKTYHLWKVAHTAADITGNYSFYLADDFGGTYTAEAPLSITTGLDVGTRTIAAINYERPTGDAQDVIIRTNGGTLTVKAPADTVYHHGIANEVNVIAVADHSYRLCGKVLGKLNLTIGNVVLEEGSRVSFINISDDADVEKLKVEIKSGASYGRVTASAQDKIDAIAEVIAVENKKPLETLVASSDVKAIVNDTTYTDVSSAIAAFTEPNTRFELFTDITYYNYDNTYRITLPEQSEFIGNGYTLAGNISVYADNGGLIEGVNFFNITNKKERTPDQNQRYGISGTGTLTAIYSTLTGKLVIRNCTFDTTEWDSMQLLPVAGAEIVIENNVFKHTISTFGQVRFIHVQSVQNVDFKVTIRNNDFYDCDTLESSSGSVIEVYYPTDAAKVIIENNYIDKCVVSEIVNGIGDCRYACIGTGGTSYNNGNTMILPLKETPNN